MKPLLLALILASALSAQQLFEVATIRPTSGPLPGVPPAFGKQSTTADTLTIRHTPLAEIIRRAYGLTPQELAGFPSWVNEDRWDILAKAAAPATDSQLWAMMQPLLQDRFKLTFHREPREVSGFALVVSKKGSKLERSAGGSNEFAMSAGSFRGSNVTMGRLCGLLSSVMQKPVIDATGLEGTFNFAIKPSDFATPGGTPTNLQSLVVTAIQEELGLKLDSRKVTINVLLVDHVEQPSEN
jgi:uncharacterized protein (TIGR03435 family)